MNRIVLLEYTTEQATSTTATVVDAYEMSSQVVLACTMTNTHSNTRSCSYRALLARSTVFVVLELQCTSAAVL